MTRFYASTEVVAEKKGIDFLEGLNLWRLNYEGSGEFTASGVMNYLRPYEKVKENWEDLEHYARSRRDVVFYMDNRAMLSCEKYERQLRQEQESQKW